jgi:hypothetical protein
MVEGDKIHQQFCEAVGSSVMSGLSYKAFTSADQHEPYVKETVVI